MVYIVHINNLCILDILDVIHFLIYEGGVKKHTKRLVFHKYPHKTKLGSTGFPSLIMSQIPPDISSVNFPKFFCFRKNV